jgi:hypothetical protein
MRFLYKAITHTYLVFENKGGFRRVGKWQWFSPRADLGDMMGTLLLLLSPGRGTLLKFGLIRHLLLLLAHAELAKRFSKFVNRKIRLDRAELASLLMSRVTLPRRSQLRVKEGVGETQLAARPIKSSARHFSPR